MKCKRCGNANVPVNDKGKYKNAIGVVMENAKNDKYKTEKEKVADIVAIRAYFPDDYPLCYACREFYFTVFARGVRISFERRRQNETRTTNKRAV